MSDIDARVPDQVAMERGDLWLLFCCLVALQFGYPVTLAGPGWTVAYLAIYLGVILFAVRRAQADPRRYWPLFVTSGALVVGASIYSLRQDDTGATTAMLAGVGLLQTSLLVIMVARLVRPPRKAQLTDLLLIAVTCYLLLGGVFGSVAALMEIAHPGSFADATAAGSPTWQSLFYGSYVVLATLGFGDVVPVSAWARSMWSLEAVLSTLFVAVVIARLVGAASPHRKRHAPHDEPAAD